MKREKGQLTTENDGDKANIISRLMVRSIFLYEVKMIRYPLYEKAKEMLFKEYHDNFKHVKGSAYHEIYMNEKIKHSLQVSGAGNGILKHEVYFINKDDAFIDLVRTAVLLHDIYRFREIRTLFETGQKIDHGVLGAKLLSNTKDFNDIKITLPIKHHGHMIECMYEDEEYLNQTEEIQDIIKHIAFVVRDADKIANWYLLARDWLNVKEVWFKHPNDYSKAQTKIKSELWSWFKNMEVAPNKLRDTNAESVISVLCWLFDMNYKYSIEFCRYHHLFGGLCDILRKIGVDEAKTNEVYGIMKDYVFKKFNIDI